MLPKERAIIIASLFILIVTFSRASFGQRPVENTPQARSEELKILLNSSEGKAKEPPRVFKTKEGYLRFIGAAPSTHFAVEPSKRVTPEQAASNFIEQWRNLFVSDSPEVGFEKIRAKAQNGRSYFRYKQMYAGLEVFGAEMIIQVNTAGGIEAVMSDIMRDTEMLDTGKVSFNPSIDALTARKKGIEFLYEQHQKLEFIASEPVLMIYAPVVVGNSGGPQLVWQMQVGNSGETLVKELLLIDAHSGETALHYPLTYAAMTRQIYDYVSGIWYDENSNWPTEITDVNLAYYYLGDTYHFYDVNHSRLSYDGNDATLVAKVRYGEVGAWWRESYMDIGEGLVSDDAVGHEFTHGVTQHESNLYYSNESGAINESFSDIWGEWIDLTNGAGNDTPEARKYLFEDGIYGAVASMRNPPDPHFKWWPNDKDRYFVDPDRYNHSDFYRGIDDWGGVHHNSGVGNKLCYLLKDGDIFRGYIVNGMGIEKTADLFYECQTNQLTSASDYYDLYHALTQAAIILGFSDAERYNIKKACEAVEICTDPGDATFASINKVDDVNNGSSVMPGDYITYTITYGPNGYDHNDVVITDYLPEEIDRSDITASDGGIYNMYEGTVNWQV